jgi:hypothetical protein
MRALILLFFFSTLSAKARTVDACITDPYTGETKQVQVNLAKGGLASNYLQVSTLSNRYVIGNEEDLCFLARDPRASEVHAFYYGTETLKIFADVLGMSMETLGSVLDFPVNILVNGNFYDNAYYSSGLIHLGRINQLRLPFLPEVYGHEIYLFLADKLELYGAAKKSGMLGFLFDGMADLAASMVSGSPLLGAYPAEGIRAIRDLSEDVEFEGERSDWAWKTPPVYVASNIFWAIGNRLLGRPRQHFALLHKAFSEYLKRGVGTVHFKDSFCDFMPHYLNHLTKGGTSMVERAKIYRYLGRKGLYSYCPL